MSLRGTGRGAASSFTSLTQYLYDAPPPPPAFWFSDDTAPPPSILLVSSSPTNGTTSLFFKTQIKKGGKSNNRLWDGGVDSTTDWPNQIKYAELQINPPPRISDPSKIQRKRGGEKELQEGNCDELMRENGSLIWLWEWKGKKIQLLEYLIWKAGISFDSRTFGCNGGVFWTETAWDGSLRWLWPF